MELPVLKSKKHITPSVCLEGEIKNFSKIENYL